jgi:hypothetical protein
MKFGLVRSSGLSKSAQNLMSCSSTIHLRLLPASCYFYRPTVLFCRPLDVFGNLLFCLPAPRSVWKLLILFGNLLFLFCSFCQPRYCLLTTCILCQFFLMFANSLFRWATEQLFFFSNLLFWLATYCSVRKPYVTPCVLIIFFLFFLSSALSI